jgi:hypothetical protein
VRADRVPRALWELPIDDTDDVYGVASLGDGGFATAARRARSTTGFGVTRVTGYAADRRVRWQRALPATGRAEPAALTRLSDGGLALIGHHAAGDRDKAQLWVVRLNAAGDVAWERLLGNPGEERRGRAIAALADGGLAVAGDALAGGHRGLRVARLAGDGTVRWEHSYGGDGDAVARGLAATPDGGLVVVGSTTEKRPGAAGKTNAWILRLDGDGHVVWDRAYGTAGTAGTAGPPGTGS